MLRYPRPNGNISTLVLCGSRHSFYMSKSTLIPLRITLVIAGPLEFGGKRNFSLNPCTAFLRTFSLPRHFDLDTADRLDIPN